MEQNWRTGSVKTRLKKIVKDLHVSIKNNIDFSVIITTQEKAYHVKQKNGAGNYWCGVTAAVLLKRTKTKTKKTS